MSQDKIESRRNFLKNFGKIAGAAIAVVPFVSGNLCFSKEELDKFENDLDNIQVKDGQRNGDVGTYGCSSNYHQVNRCYCSGDCGSNYHMVNRCYCSGSCGDNYSRTH